MVSRWPFASATRGHPSLGSVHTYARRVLKCLGPVPRTVAKPNTSLGLAKSVIHPSSCTYEPSNVYISIHPQQKAYLEPYNIGVHMPRTHEGSYPSKVITMRPSDSSSSQHKLNGSSMKAIAATRSFAAECKSSRLGARRAR